jgi:hypothetical protein
MALHGNYVQPVRLSFQPLIFSQPAVCFLSQQINQQYFQPLIFSPSE